MTKISGKWQNLKKLKCVVGCPKSFQYRMVGGKNAVNALMRVIVET